MPFRAKILVWTICLAASISLLAAYVLAPDQPIQTLQLALGLGCFAIVAELLVYQMPQGGHGSIALIPFLSIALVAPSWQGIIVVGVAEAICQAIRRREPLKLAFNTAQAALSITIALFVYTQLGGVSFREPAGFGATLANNAFASIAALATVALVNSFSVSGVIAFSEEQSFLDVWRRNTLGTIAYTLLAWPFACGLAYVYAQIGPIAAVALAIPMVGVRQLYKTTLQLQQINRELLEMMVKAIEARDPYTSGHSRRVAKSATIIARGLGLSAAAIERVRIAALLHDIGKIHEDFAPLLRKESSLTATEWAVMQTHAAKGAELVDTLSDLRDLTAPIRHHHENWNGTGYPDGIAGEAIPLAARIITFADTIDALTTDRPYRKAFGPSEVRAELVRCRGTQFDPAICDIVLGQSVWSQIFAPGTPVRLTIVGGPAKRAANS
jgi:putative nucleotidyltransferase with HDIG domain